MEKIKVIIPSDIHHNCQIVTGFLLLKEQGWDVEIENFERKEHPFRDRPVVLAEYRGKRLLYDLWDGYQAPELMRECLGWSDFYFKRSFSEKQNRKFFPVDLGKIQPLGFNYHVTHKKNPINEPIWKEKLKPLQGRAPDKYFTPEVFEGKAERKSEQPKILFLTRLWDKAPGLLQDELEFINQTRIEIVRTLRKNYADAFVGGLNDLPISRQLAPDLIMPAKLTERRKYLKQLHTCDICIGTMGLHASIGWKTGEYVAAAKAIVHDKLQYAVTGDFAAGKNYLEFTTARECIDAVDRLVQDPEKLYRMKQANEEYYGQYLRPDKLVKNSLELVDQKIF